MDELELNNFTTQNPKDIKKEDNLNELDETFDSFTTFTTSKEIKEENIDEFDKTFDSFLTSSSIDVKEETAKNPLKDSQKLKLTFRYCFKAKQYVFICIHSNCTYSHYDYPVVLRHILKHNDPLELYYDTRPRCEHCEQAFENNSLLRKHSKLHLDQYPNRCIYCERTFQLKETLYRHLQTQHDDRIYKCTECCHKFKTKQNLKFHFEAQHVNLFECPECRRKFKTERDLKNHFKTHIRNEKKNALN